MVDLAESEIGHVVYGGAAEAATALIINFYNIKIVAFLTIHMSKFGMYSEGPKISIDEHMSKMDEHVRSIFQEIRGFVLSLGSNVVEEVRPHRIVYGKSLIFRTFLDIQPLNNALAISVKMELRGMPNEIIINSKEQLTDLKDRIREAYVKI